MRSPVLSEEVRFRAPPGLLAAAEEAAGRDHRTVSAFVAQLRELGLPIAPERTKRDRAEREAVAAS